MVEGSPTASVDLRHAALLRFMTPEFMASVVGHVLDHKDELLLDVRRKLDSAIKSVVRIPRFPNQPERAPAPLLKQSIVAHLVDSEPLVNAIFQSWFLSQAAIHAKIKGYLYTRDIEVEYPDFNTHKFRGAWSFDTWMSERDAILSAHKDLLIDDVALMLCFSTDNIPTDPPTDLQGEMELMDDGILNQARRYLEHLPADADEWSVDVPHFLTAVSEIADRKEFERESVAVARALNSQVAELDQYSSRLSYLELDISSWRASVDLPVVDVTRISGLLREFAERLEEYDLVLQAGSSFSETRRLRDEHEEASRLIQELKGEIDQVLLVRSESRDGERTPAVEDKTETKDHGSDLTGGISDIKLSEGTFEFNPTRTNYSLEVENTVELLSVTPVPTRPGATIEITFDTPTGETIEASEVNDDTFIVSPLLVGQTVIHISATPEDSNSSEAYTLSVTRSKGAVVAPIPSTDATLKLLSVSDADIEFNPEVTHYSFGLNEGLDRFSLKPEPAHETASVYVTVNLPDGTTVGVSKTGEADFLITPELLSYGDIAIHIDVTAEDGETTQVYTVIAKQEIVPGLPAHLWNLVAQDDLAGAYWIARAIESQGTDPVVPSPLLKAVHGGRCLSPNSDTFVEDLFLIVAESEVSEDDDSQVLLRLAAALMPSLVAPETGLSDWLAAPSCLPGLDAVLSHIKTYANTGGRPLLPEHVSGDEGNQQLQGLIVQASAEAKQWLEEAPQNQTNFNRAVRVLQYLCKDGVLSQMLTPVAEDHRDKLHTVQVHLDSLDRAGYTEMINSAENSIGARPGRSTEIVGKARDWLVSRIEEAKVRASRWISLVSREAESRTPRSDEWLMSQVTSLRGQLQIGFPSAMEGLLELSSEGNPPAVAAAAMCAARSMQQMVDYLRLETQHETLQQTSAIVRRLRTLIDVSGTPTTNGGRVDQLEVALSRRLLWAPQVILDDDGLLVSEESLLDLASSPASFDLNSTALEEVMQIRTDHHDFRFFELLIYGLPAGEVDRLSRKFLGELTAERKTLQGVIESTNVAVEQADKDGVIEFEGSHWSKYKNALDDVNVKEALNFGPIYDALDGVKAELLAERRRRGQELLEEWQALEGEVDSDSDNKGDLLVSVKGTFEIASSIDSMDIRVMEDCVSRVRNGQLGEEGNFSRVQEQSQSRALEEFQDFYKSLRDPKAHTRNSEGLNNLIQELKREV